jgi:hypothetical protein
MAHFDPKPLFFQQMHAKEELDSLLWWFARNALPAKFSTRRRVVWASFSAL